jgi:LPS export ABC transporter protein LptC
MLFSVACSSEKKDFLPNFADAKKVPVIYTDSVTTLISDSGRIRYRVKTEVWEILDKISDPCWYFPKKVYFERFNDSLKIESVVQCDTARYFTSRGVWELKKHVKLINLKGEKFETSLLYWDQSQQRIYSDSFIRIEQKDRVLTGYGFESNQTLTKYEIRNGGAQLPVDTEGQ